MTRAQTGLRITSRRRGGGARQRQGAERLVYHCTEIDEAGMPLGPMLVAKQTLFEELMRAADFHVAFCRVQAEAQALAALFNRRCGPAAPRAWAVSFLHVCSEITRRAANFIALWVSR